MNEIVKTAQDVKDREAAWALPGTRRAQERDRVEAQQPWTQDFVDGFKNTALYGAGRYLSQERLTALVPRPDGPDYDKEEMYDELTQGIPYEYHDDILSHDTLAAARRSRVRTQEDLRRGQRLAQQDSGHLAMLAGSIVDVDLPLAMLSGGAYGSAKVARTALKAARTARMSPRAALRTSNLAQGTNAGLQAGVAVGALDASTRATTEWTDIAGIAVTSMLMGGAIGTAAGGDVRASANAAQQEFLDNVARDAPEFRENLDVNQMPVERLEIEEPAATPDAPEADTAATAEVEQPRLNLEEAYSRGKNASKGNYTRKERKRQADRTQLILKDEAVRTELEDILTEFGITDLELVGQGKFKDVLGNDKYVVRIGGETNRYPDHPNVLKPLTQFKVGTKTTRSGQQYGGWNVEIMPRVKTKGYMGRVISELTKGPQKFAASAGERSSAGEGAPLKFDDYNSANFGTLPNGDEVVFDGVSPANPEDIAHIPDLEEFRASMKDDFTRSQGSDSVGAASMGTAYRGSTAQVPGASPTNMTWIDAAMRWRHDSGWADRKAKDDAEWWGKVAQSTGMNLTTSNFNRLYKSNSAVANFLAGNIFESTNGLGRGRATAATQSENYNRRIQSHLNERVRQATEEWAKRNNKTWNNTGYHISEEGKALFNREVMLELNNRRLGRKETTDPDVKRAADQYEAAGQEALHIGRGRDGETSVAGFEDIPDTRGYTPYKWSGQRIRAMIANGTTTEDDVLAAMARAYRNAGLATGKDADAIAKAVLQRAMAKEDGIDMSVMSLMSGDGKDFMREGLILGGLGEAQADAILDRLIGKQHNQSKEGFAKTRNDIDMDEKIVTSNGEDLRIVDLFDNDLHGVWQRYSRQMAGSAALARHGITNRAQRTEIIDAMSAEMRALGETPPDKELMEAMFSHFNAGPIHGYTKMAGRNEGIGEVALMKRITNLALLNKLGITQLAETGVMIAQNGLENWLRRGPGAWLDKEIKAGNKELLDDLAFITGDIGQDHWHFAPWLDLDDVSAADRSRFMQAVHKQTSNASFIQGYTSVFNQVRSFQQQTAVLGMADKVFREIKRATDEGRDLDEGLLGRFENDLGLFREDVQALEQLVSSGVIEFKTRGKQTFVNRLNVDQWDSSIADVFASSVTRNMNQLVQKSMAGEQDAWMHSHFGSLMTHLMTFPLQAMQKQAMRNFRYMDKQAMGAVLYGLGTAGIMVKIKDAIDGRERDWKDTAHAAVNYSNMTGFLPMIYDPIMSMLGMDDARVNQYGPHYDFTPPVLSVGQNMLRAPGAVGNVIQGDADWYDQQALKALPFANAYFLNRIFE